MPRVPAWAKFLALAVGVAGLIFSPFLATPWRVAIALIAVGLIVFLERHWREALPRRRREEFVDTTGEIRRGARKYVVVGATLIVLGLTAFLVTDNDGFLGACLAGAAVVFFGAMGLIGWRPPE